MSLSADTTEALEARNLRIAESYRKGATLRALGRKYGKTGERIRQIVLRQGIVTRPPGRTPDPGRRPRRRKTLQDRFFEKLRIVEKASGTCWVWLKTDERGYGTFALDGRLQYAHRVAFFLVNGRRPKRMAKVCNTPGCVRPGCWQETSSIPGSRKSPAV